MFPVWEKTNGDIKINKEKNAYLNLLTKEIWKPKLVNSETYGITMYEQLYYFLQIRYSNRNKFSLLFYLCEKVNLKYTEINNEQNAQNNIL